MTDLPDPAVPSALGILLAISFIALVAATAILALLLVRQRAVHRRLRAQADEAAHSADAFFDLVTHELRSPLAAILGYQELLNDGMYGEMGEQAAEPVDRIGRSARHLLHLIEGLVEVGRLRAGRVRPDLEHVDLRIIALGLADALRTHAADRHVTATIDIDPDLPAIRSDTDRLVRALDLLIVSAVKHPGDDHEVRLHVQRHEHGATFRITGAAIPLRNEAHDPAVRFGLRIAAAQGIATVLGGGLDLDLDPERGDSVRGMSFRVRHADDVPVAR